MRKATLSAPAKINLALHIGNKRPDRFHDIWSIMQTISLSDTLRVASIKGGGADAEDQITVTGPEARSIVGDSNDNVVLQTVRALRDEGHEIPPLQIDLDKQIPVGAGLGGGSSDAAAILKGLNKACKLKISTNELSKIGAKLGSDIPFFFSKGTAQVTGRGEIVKPLKLPMDYHIAIIIPSIRVPSGPAYRLLNRKPAEEGEATSSLTTTNTELNFSSSQLGAGGSQRLFARLEEQGNDFESKFLESNNLDAPYIGFDVRELASELSEINEGLRQAGAAFVRLSGSGSAVFGIFFSPVTGDRLKSFLRHDWMARICQPIAIADD
jgi:4-diphosphocytidyl-2-C-methyl-D-erythritol kinase